MRRWVLAAVLMLLVVAGGASGVTTSGSKNIYCTQCGLNYGAGCPGVGTASFPITPGYNWTVHTSWSFDGGCISYCVHPSTDGELRAGGGYVVADFSDGEGSNSFNGEAGTTVAVTYFPGWDGLKYYCCEFSATVTFTESDQDRYTASGSTNCIDYTKLYLYQSGSYDLVDSTDSSSYSFDIYNGSSYRLTFDGAYYDFICDGNEVFDYDACLYVYGYTCGIEHIKLWKDDGGWVLEDTYYHATIGVNPYEMQITDGNDYKLNFSDGHEYLFSCTGSHVLYDWDRCPWVYPPSPWVDPVPIVIYVGYDNRIVLLRDAHGNFIEHSQIAVYDQTDDVYLQKWTDNPEGYLVLAARYNTNHDVQIAVKTFDSVHTTTTVYPMNGTAENLTWTNWTIPIMYNIQMEPVDTYNVPLFDVFCGLAEYTPINPLSFWGMDFNRGYVPVTNCSGFSRYDIIAEKGGYVPYEVTGLNWTAKTAMVKDYRHEIIMTKE